MVCNNNKLIFTGNKFFHREMEIDSDEYKLYTLLDGLDNKNILIVGDYASDLKSMLSGDNNIVLEDIDLEVSELKRGSLLHGKFFPSCHSSYLLDDTYDMGDLDYEYIITTSGIKPKFDSGLNLNLVFPVIMSVFKKCDGLYKVVSHLNMRDVLVFDYEVNDMFLNKS